MAKRPNAGPRLRMWGWAARLGDETMRKLVRNAVRCKLCGDVIESTHRHDFKRCSCGAVAVDGGLDYARRCFNTPDDFEELSEYEGGDEPGDE